MQWWTVSRIRLTGYTVGGCGMGQNRKYVVIGGLKIQLGRYTISKPFKGITTEIGYFGGYQIPKNTDLSFFESVNFGFVKYKDELGLSVLVKE